MHILQAFCKEIWLCSSICYECTPITRCVSSLLENLSVVSLSPFKDYCPSPKSPPDSDLLQPVAYSSASKHITQGYISNTGTFTGIMVIHIGNTVVDVK